MTLLGSILKHALFSPTRTAVVDDRGTYSYAKLAGGAFFLAERLGGMSASPNIGILLPTSGAFPMSLMGAWLAGRAAVPYNYLLGKDELGYVIRDSGADTIVTAGPFLNLIGGADLIPPGVNVLKLEEQDFHGVPPFRFPPLTPADAPAVVLYTSGTSGKPKGVQLTHGNLKANVWAAVEAAQLERADVFLGVLPQFHSFGLTGLTLLPLAVGSKIAYSARFVPRKVVQTIREHRPEVVMFVPSMYGALLSLKDASAEDFKSIRFAVSGGEPLSRSLAEEFESRFGVKVLEGYGLTETSPVVSWATPTANKPGSVGAPLPGVEVAIVDENNRPLPRGAEGEILIAGPNVMRGYFNLPEMTAEVVERRRLEGFAGGRWFRTGDLGRIDEEGFLFITGRKKEMLKVAGEMVIPREVEETLNKHPTVAAAAVIGKRDEMRGEVPVAFVELKEGQTFDENALRNWCRESLAAFKVPRDIRQMEKLPRNATGKILRRQLKAD